MTSFCSRCVTSQRDNRARRILEHCNLRFLMTRAYVHRKAPASKCHNFSLFFDAPRSCIRPPVDPFYCSDSSRNFLFIIPSLNNATPPILLSSAFQIRDCARQILLQTRCSAVNSEHIAPPTPDSSRLQPHFGTSAVLCSAVQLSAFLGRASL
jgi:hypothetical protein